jgi:hypothetical protein
MNCLICSLAILVNFAPLYHSHVNTFAAAGAVIEQGKGNLIHQFLKPLSGFLDLIPGRDFKKIVVLNYLTSGQGLHR